MSAPLDLQPFLPAAVRPSTPDLSIEAQMRALKEADEAMSNSGRKRDRSETPPLPAQCLRPAEVPNVWKRPVLTTDLPHRRSIYVGVNWDHRWEKWKARIMIDGKMRHLGYFELEADAAAEYDKFAKANPGKPLNFPGEGQAQAVKKAAVVRRTDLLDEDRLRGHEWLTNGLLGKYDYSESSRAKDTAAECAPPLPADTPYGWSQFSDIPKDAMVEARYVAQLLEHIIFQARQEKIIYFEKIHQVSADLTDNAEIRYAAVKMEVAPARVIAMGTKALLQFKRNSCHHRWQQHYPAIFN